MALGYCLTCDKLVPIKPGERKPDSLQRWWWPVEHDAPDGKRCWGSKRPI